MFSEQKDHEQGGERKTYTIYIKLGQKKRRREEDKRPSKQCRTTLQSLILLKPRRRKLRKSGENGFAQNQSVTDAGVAPISVLTSSQSCTGNAETPTISSASLGVMAFACCPSCKAMAMRRYLIRHYFENTETSYTAIEEPSGFCLYGYVTALMVLAWHRLPDKVSDALGYVYIAKHLLGHYHSFDFIGSSSWPISSFLVHYGASFYYEQLQWQNTVESLKPQPGAAPFWPVPGYSPDKWRGLGSGPRRLVVWQFCIHTSTAGEAVTMITRFLRDDFQIQWLGNSLAPQLCVNYQPALCADGRNREFLDWMCDRFEAADTSYKELSERFQEELLPQLSKADVWMCSIPAVWCRLLWDAAMSLKSQNVPPKAIFAYLGLPILQHVRHDEREDFLYAFVEMAQHERNIVAANNAYLAEEVAWQTGLKIPTLRIHGLHTNATYLPLRSDEVLVSRPGTSGGWQECILNRFVDANPDYPFRFIQFTNLLNPHTTEEVYNNSLSYQALSQYRAVGFPYDTSLMFFWEFYSMNMPMFVPFDLWIFPKPGTAFSKLLSEEERLPFSPFFSGFAPLDLERSIFWSKYTDWAMFPHVQYFKSVPDLMSQLLTIDLEAVSSAMKLFNEECMVKSVAAWRFVVERWCSEKKLGEAVGILSLLPYRGWWLSHALARSPVSYPGLQSHGVADAEGFGMSRGCEAKKKTKARSKQGPEPETVGVGAACGPLGIWALTFQEIMLGLGMLKAGGAPCA
eukprot:symbB.v1.2.026265.t1/scaffold2611.1/size89775/9